jgi:hypothetical protein
MGRRKRKSLYIQWGDMLLSIVLVLCFIAAVAFGVLLFAPIKLSCSGSYTGSARQAAFYLFWLHPGVLRCDFNGKKRSISIMVLGRYRLFSSEEDQAPEAAPAPGTGGADQFAHEKPVIERPAPPDGNEKSYDHRSSGPAPKQKKSKKPPEGSVDKQKKEKANDDSGRETKGLFGFLQDPVVRRVKVFLVDAKWRYKIFRWLRTSVVRFFHIVSVPCFRLHVKLGLSDPSDAGRAFGYYIALKSVIMDTGVNAGRLRHQRELVFEPVFNRELIEADGRVEISSSIARLCLPVVLAVVTFPFLHTFILYWRARKIK